jgi:hypothetical protein
MPGQVGQNQQTAFTSPASGQPRQASVVLANDNNLRAKHNAHDSDATIHALSGLLVDRPAPGTAGRKYFATDTLRWSYDNGVSWDDQDVAPENHSHPASEVTPGTFAAGDFAFPQNVSVQGQGGSDQHDAGDSGAALGINWNNGNCQKLRLTGNCVFTFTNAVAGRTYLLRIAQDGAGNRTATWPAAVHWPGGTAPTLTVTANKVDIIAFYFDGATFFGSLVGFDYVA